MASPSRSGSQKRPERVAHGAGPAKPRSEFEGCARVQIDVEREVRRREQQIRAEGQREARRDLVQKASAATEQDWPCGDGVDAGRLSVRPAVVDALELLDVTNLAEPGDAGDIG